MSDATDDLDGEAADDARTGREQHWVSGENVVGKLKELLHEGNVRHIVIKNEEGKKLIEVPVSVGVAGALLLPVWAAVGAVAAVVTKCSIEVQREDEDEAEG